ncbi:hypothetical protein AB0C69_26960 [Actinomadura sp. NPDC048032]|uniref:hypothetical protein n=1 Tax=Actinomadura sp. NPDC048032 TaxID=3155747 RepID=UPI0033DBA9E6
MLTVARNWEPWTTIIGIGFGVIATCGLLIEIEGLSNRSGFGHWGVGALVAGAAFGVYYALEKWRPGLIYSILMVAVLLLLAVFAFYVILAGFGRLRREEDESARRNTQGDSTGGSRSSIGAYEWASLIVAGLSLLSSIVAAALSEMK